MLSADFCDIRAAIADVENCRCPWIHLDVMDGRFVPPITFGSKMVADIRSRTALFLDVHLMVEAPERHVQEFMESGADAITFHAEACVHSHRLLQRIREGGKSAGISLVPATPISAIAPLLESADHVLVMTVNPGYGGQELLPFCLDKVRELNAFRRERRLNFTIAVDGGVNCETISLIAASDPDILVIGSAFFGADNKQRFVAQLRQQWKEAIEAGRSIR